MHRWESIMCREFTEAVGELWRTIGYALNSYRPELHYMRGPGPKWHARHEESELSREDRAGRA
jgi:hypothetical protein